MTAVGQAGQIERGLGVQAGQYAMGSEFINDPVLDEHGCLFERSKILEAFKRAATAREQAVARQASGKHFVGDEYLLSFAQGEMSCPRTGNLIHENALVTCSVPKMPESAEMPAPTQPETQPIVISEKETIFEAVARLDAGQKESLKSLKEIKSQRIEIKNLLDQMKDTERRYVAEKLRNVSISCVIGMALGCITKNEVLDEIYAQKEIALLVSKSNELQGMDSRLVQEEKAMQRNADALQYEANTLQATITKLRASTVPHRLSSSRS